MSTSRRRQVAQTACILSQASRHGVRIRSVREEIAYLGFGRILNRHVGTHFANVSYPTSAHYRSIQRTDMAGTSTSARLLLPLRPMISPGLSRRHEPSRSSCAVWSCP